jgi:ubiquinone/menaquinone biosynthesis C-methylase UbiE
MPDKSSNLKKYQSKNPLQQFLVRRFLNLLLKLIVQVAPESILDVGCGEGYLEELIIQRGIKAKIVGIDISDKALQIARRKSPQAVFQEGDIYNLPFQDSQFDLVLAVEVLEHLQNPMKALLEIKRVSNKHYILSVPNEPIFTVASLLAGRHLKSFGRHPEHIQAWSKKGFVNFASLYFAKVIVVKTSFPWTILLVEK